MKACNKACHHRVITKPKDDGNRIAIAIRLSCFGGVDRITHCRDDGHAQLYKISC